MNQLGYAPERKRIPVVFNTAEVRQVLRFVPGLEGTLARLLYGTGMRLSEGLSVCAPSRRRGRHQPAGCAKHAGTLTFTINHGAGCRAARSKSPAE